MKKIEKNDTIGKLNKIDEFDKWSNKQLIYFQNITIDSPLEYSNLLADSTKTGPSEMPHLFSVCVRGQRWAPLPLLPEYQHWPRTRSKKRWDNSGGPFFAECTKHGPKFGVLCRRINRYILEINEWFIKQICRSAMQSNSARA